MWVPNSSSDGLNWSGTLFLDFRYISGEKFLANAFSMIQNDKDNSSSVNCSIKNLAL